MAVKSKNEMDKKKYILIEPALGLPAGSVIDGPGAEVLVNNGKALPYVEESEPKPVKAAKKGEAGK